LQKVLTYEQYSDLNPTYDPGEYFDTVSREQIERHLDVDACAKLIEHTRRNYLPSRGNGGEKLSFLDVGCGMGANLLAAQRLGFEVLGFEPSKDHARVAIDHFALPVITEYFSPDRTGGRKFDFIMLSHVIEHIFDPKKFISDLVGILKPGGALVVVTPNSDSLIARVTGAQWPMLKPVDHVSLISAKAYDFFQLDGSTRIHHRYSEYPFEFATTLASVFKDKLKGHKLGNDKAPQQPAGAVPLLRRFNPMAQVMKLALIAASAPAWLLAVAAGKQACLVSVIVHRN
jgi:2-polyprenyl-3-methyl-5-hydroxy-6-metoxy-1,4-benzoquinol methylase